ncbi:MAG: hypothetical protein NT062_25205 [Proteobacteria bacterium]|nr:hypothetical protein [Pseudomonadota bacterium]
MNLIAELEAVLDALARAGVEHAICGGFAVNIHGHVRATRDIDLLIPSAHLAAAKTVLATIGFDITAGPIPFGIGTPHHRILHRVSRLDARTLLTIDLMVVTPIFEPVWATRQRVVWHARDLTVVSLEGLGRMKRLAGRPQDLADLEQLGLGADADADE